MANIKNIRDALKTSLEGITTANGYSVTIGAVYADDRDINLMQLHEPTLILDRIITNNVQVGSFQVEKTTTWHVSGYLRDSSDPEGAAMDLAADIEKKLWTDFLSTRFSNLVANLRFIADIQGPQYQEQRRSNCHVQFETVHYEDIRG